MPAECAVSTLLTGLTWLVHLEDHEPKKTANRTERTDDWTKGREQWTRISRGVMDGEVRDT